MKECNGKNHKGTRLLNKLEFGKLKISKDGLNYLCKACERERSREKYLRDRDKILARDKEYRERNKIKLAESQRERNKCNKDDRRAYSRAYYLKNKDKLAAYGLAYYTKNRERLLVSASIYRETTKAARAEYDKLWSSANRDKKTFNSNKRRKQIKRATPLWADQLKIAAIYSAAAKMTESTGETYHVHHIVPISWLPIVCGLHCPDNLIVVTEADHILIHSGRKYSTV